MTFQPFSKGLVGSVVCSSNHNHRWLMSPSNLDACLVVTCLIWHHQQQQQLTSESDSWFVYPLFIETGWDKQWFQWYSVHNVRFKYINHRTKISQWSNEVPNINIISALKSWLKCYRFTLSLYLISLHVFNFKQLRADNQERRDYIILIWIRK